MDYKVGDVIRFSQDSIHEGIGTIRRFEYGAGELARFSVEVHKVIRRVNGGGKLHRCNGLFDSDIGWFVTSSNILEVISEFDEPDINEADFMKVLSGC